MTRPPLDRVLSAGRTLLKRIAPPLIEIEDAGHERQTSGDAPAGEPPTRTVLGRAC